MFALNDNEMAMLELLVVKPLSHVPPHPDMLARRLRRQGLAALRNGIWYPTRKGIGLTGGSLH